jgi:hypothetical protein
MAKAGELQMQLDDRSTLLCDLEKKLHRPEIRASADEVAALLADEFFEFGASGTVWTRQHVIERLPQEKPQPACELDSREFRSIGLPRVSLWLHIEALVAFHLKQRNSTSCAARSGNGSMDNGA